ncbi:hypothetical protein [Mariprofundus ferrooxydans]|uniref:Uncharacterized protein n=1 Tax=Mariprofundus ferrooxydans PV-1 TaxID=314345 RepID=A0A0H4CTE2_9PROT|nr:hypothetical protein [Mariprofundus ferrooxydans]AKN78221.1 hypothetical protein [Mariprofundus ferrooxydans PV-1]KON47481.1 hypothetical protein AL013_08300 [Mariprofundus ferrooxydans]
MTTCSVCGAETGREGKICLSCHKHKVSGTWKRQIRVYLIIIIAGATAFAYAVTKIKALPHSETLQNGIPPHLLYTAEFGGLGILGGLFGLSLALFLKFLHRNK